ncbi:MAG: repeat protein [Pedosphaera sp.]|nr:repeat protein [Pedosphaera sp.]
MKKIISCLAALILVSSLQLKAQFTFRNDDSHVGDDHHAVDLWILPKTVLAPKIMPGTSQTFDFSWMGTGTYEIRWACWNDGFVQFATPSGSILVNGSTKGFMSIGACSDGKYKSSDTEDNDDNDDCRTKCQSCGGMPVWHISEPYISLWLHDEPLGYQPAHGPRVSFKLSFSQRESTAGFNTNFFSAGKKWDFSWFSYVTQDASGSNVVHFSGGRQKTFRGSDDYITNARLSGGKTTGFALTYPDGSQDVYGFIVTNNAGVFQEAFLTERKNAQSEKISFAYQAYAPSAPIVRLQNVIDGDGRTNWVYYNTNNPYSTNLISQIIDAFGRTNSLDYDNAGRLTNITDVAGLSTGLVYDGSNWVTSMTTPYGTTSFQLKETVAGNFPPNGRSALITNPDGGKELFLYTNSAPGIDSSYSPGEVPSTTPFANTLDNSHLDLRNTFYWGPRQYSALSITNISSFTINDFRKARMQHWLQTGSFISQTLSMQRDPSPDSDGTISGQKTWYDYAGKTNAQYVGIQTEPLLKAQVLPNGTTSFFRTERNSIGNVVTNISTYSMTSGVALRTNTFTYDTSGIDMITARNALGIQTSSNAYNAYHQILTNYNALSEKTTLMYDSSQNLISRAAPNGLITTNIYNSDGLLAATYGYSVISGVPTYFGTNSYLYTNDLVYAHTDPRGLAITNTWDNLQRLVSVTFPDGTFITNRYKNLDLVYTGDRMGSTNAFGYDAMRRKIAETNSLGNYTLYDYCNCGVLNSVRDAGGNYTYFYHDNLSRLTNAVYADTYSLTNQYNLINQLTNTTDSAGMRFTTWFNNQGLRYAVSNYFGQVSKQLFDVEDRAYNSVDANGVTITNLFDNLNRILVRGYPDGGTEQFFYTTNGLVAYTNQLGQPTLYDYDAMGRKTAETNANLEITRHTYTAANDLRTLSDGNQHVTTWNYDEYGLVTNKVDNASRVLFQYQYDPDFRLTNRLSAAKGTTTYTYDLLGNLLTIQHPVSPSITNQYDALNRLTNMLDGVGMTRYTYTSVGQLQSEDGPWEDDTVTYGYSARQRTSLNLQQPNASPWMQTYSYDAAARLTNVTSQAGSFGYAYDPVRNTQVRKLSLPNSAYITNAYDGVSRVLSTVLKNATNGTLNAHLYGYNAGNQRTQQVFSAGNYMNYTYDNISQLKTAFGTEAGGVTNRFQEQLSYVYDAAHNLNYRTNNALAQNFGVNDLNQLTTVTRAGTLTVAGTTSSTATKVTVNGTDAALYSDATFAATNFTLANGNNTFTALAQDGLGRRDTNAVTMNLPVSSSYLYDLNGNLLSDGSRAFDYDDENQLIRVTVTNAWKSEFSYDGRMRRRIRKEFTWQGSAWALTNELHYVYDGNLVIQERNASNLPVVTYTRGNDLSRSLQGAGGIGGLLARSDSSSQQTAFYHADGNGNITALINAQQVLAAKYLYDTFGNILSKSGPLAEANLYRFSSKEFHQNSGLAYYLYRFYDPNLQRWLNRDPLAEAGGVNLYSFVNNEPTILIDPDGRDWLSPSTWTIWPFNGKSKQPTKAPVPADPKGCWAGLPSDKLAKIPCQGVAKLAEAQALRTGCEACCAQNFFDKGDLFNQCMAYCEAKYVGMIGIGKK